MDTAGGAYAWPTGGFCYCVSSDSSGLSRCSCYEAQVWPNEVVMPRGLSVLSNYGSIGRFGIDPSEACPSGTYRREEGTRAECVYGPGDYVYAPRGDQGISLIVSAPLSAATMVPGSLSPQTLYGF